MGRKITNKRGSHIKEAYDVVGDISTRSTLARMTRILRLNRPYKCLKLGGELHLEMGKNFGDFLGFLGPAQSWELCPRWFSMYLEERWWRGEESSTPQKPTKFLETSRENWRRVIFIRLSINEADSGDQSIYELFSEIDYSKFQQRIQRMYQITNATRHLTCRVTWVRHFLPECHFVQLSNCTWNSFQSGKVYLIYCNSVLTIFISGK